jgi:hypothetical protein
MAVPADLLLSAFAGCDCGCEEPEERPLTSEPAVIDDVPLTSEPPLAGDAPLTSEPPAPEESAD